MEQNAETFKLNIDSPSYKALTEAIGQIYARQYPREPIDISSLVDALPIQIRDIPLDKEHKSSILGNPFFKASSN